MGDNLPELLYRAWANGMGLSYGSDETPGWNNLTTVERDSWEQVAVKARGHVRAQVIAEIESLRDQASDDWDHMLFALRAGFGR